MAEKLMDATCSEFAAALAAKVSVPGGGGAAAYVGALGMALGEMAGNFTLGKKKYADVEPDIQRMLAEGAVIREKLLTLVDDDAAAFEPLSKAYGIPKEDPTRAEVLEAVTKDALAAPLEMMRQIAAAVELLEELELKGSRMLISDVGCGAALAAAAMRAASMNVFINTKSLTDRAFADAVDTEADELLGFVPRAEAVADRVMAGLR